MQSAKESPGNVGNLRESTQPMSAEIIHPQMQKTLKDMIKSTNAKDKLNMRYLQAALIVPGVLWTPWLDNDINQQLSTFTGYTTYREAARFVLFLTGDVQLFR